MELSDVRIIQADDNEFHLERRFREGGMVGRWPFKKLKVSEKWIKIDRMGNSVRHSPFGLLTFKSLKEANDWAIKFVRKNNSYPIIHNFE